jgi:hypothetical protein
MAIDSHVSAAQLESPKLSEDKSVIHPKAGGEMELGPEILPGWNRPHFKEQ